MTEDWMVGWHHQFIEFEQALGDYEGEGRLLCFSLCLLGLCPRRAACWCSDSAEPTVLVSTWGCILLGVCEHECAHVLVAAWGKAWPGPVGRACTWVP